MDEQSKNVAAEKENEMYMGDKEVADTENRKNELESFIYELRGELDDRYAEFANEEEKSKVREKLSQTEVCSVAFQEERARDIEKALLMKG